MWPLYNDGLTLRLHLLYDWNKSFEWERFWLSWILSHSSCRHRSAGTLWRDRWTPFITSVYQWIYTCLFDFGRWPSWVKTQEIQSVNKWTRPGVNSRDQEGKDQLTIDSVGLWWVTEIFDVSWQRRWWWWHTHSFIVCPAVFTTRQVGEKSQTWRFRFLGRVHRGRPQLRRVVYRPAVRELFPPDADWQDPVSVWLAHLAQYGVGQPYATVPPGSLTVRKQVRS